jgi:hypothetical protein
LEFAIMLGATRCLLSPLCLAIAIALVAPRLSAQTEEDRAAARSLATQGIAAYSEGRHGVALDLFSRAESLLHAPPHVLYMARAAAKLGQLVRARELYLKLGREELPASAPQAFRDAQIAANDEVRAVEPRLANLVINVKVPPGLDATSVKVEMDKKPISAAVLGVSFPADPGKHHLMASAPGFQSKLVEVTLAEAGRGAAELLLAPTGAPVPMTVGQPVQPAPAARTATPVAVVGIDSATMASGSPAWMRPLSYVAMGVGVLGLGAGTVFGLASRGNRTDADSLESQCGSPCLNSDPLVLQIDAKDNQARRQMTLAVVGFVVGGVGVASGVTLFALSSRKPTKSARSVTPFVGWGNAGLSGTW